MIPAARVQSAIEVLADIEQRRRPAADALKDWGLAHRFAGSKDRAAIAGLVYDALRRRASAAWLAGEATPRAIMLGALRLARGLDLGAVAALANGERHAPAALGEAEQAALGRDPAEALASAPAHIACDYPEWLDASLGRAFGGSRHAEMAALATRAPIDIRVNTLKTLRDRLRPALAHFGPLDTPYSPIGLRFEAGEGGRGPALQATAEFQKGHFEIQDEGSQLVALMCGSEPGMQVVDLCAGAGGKTLALAALMNNTGQIYAADSDPRRLAPIHQRLERAGVRNVQVRTPRGRDHDPLAGIEGKADLVLVDAPCTGTGTWRRNPDIKWRMRPGALAQRIADQDATLARAARFVRPRGRIAYVTCSVLCEENGDRVAAFLAAHSGFRAVRAADLLPLAPDALSERVDLQSPDGLGLQLTPHRTGTDGFYLAILQRSE